MLRIKHMDVFYNLSIETDFRVGIQFASYPRLLHSLYCIIGHSVVVGNNVTIFK